MSSSCTYNLLQSPTWRLIPKRIRICYTACSGRIWIISKKSEKINLKKIQRNLNFCQKFQKLLYKFSKMSFLRFFFSDPASACCVAYLQILGIITYYNLILPIFSATSQFLLFAQGWCWNGCFGFWRCGRGTCIVRRQSCFGSFLL